MTVNGTDMFEEFFVRNKKKMILVRLPGIILLLVSVPFLNGNFGWLTGMRIGWLLLIAALIWFGVATKFEVSGKKVNECAEQLLDEDRAAAQGALEKSDFGADDSAYRLVSALYLMGDGVSVRRTGAARDGYLSSVSVTCAMAFEKRSGGLWIYRMNRELIGGGTDVFQEHLPFDRIESVTVTPVEYGEKNSVYRKLLRFDIKTEEGGAELLFDEDYDSKRAADELIKLAGGKNRTDRG